MRVLLLRAGEFPRLDERPGPGGLEVTVRSIVRLRPVPGMLAAFRSALRPVPERPFGVVAWTSRHAVEFVFAEAERQGLGAQTREDLSPWMQASLGPATGEALAQRGFPVAFQPRTSTTEALAHRLLEVGATRVVLPRNRRGSNVFAEVLSRGSVPLTVVEVYEPEPDEGLLALTVKEVRGGVYDALGFTSAMEVETFFAAWDREGAAPRPFPRRVRLGALGPVTAEALRRRGLEPEVSPQARAESLLRLLGASAHHGAPPP
jgi:uroporphyrinogen-III synthase